MTGTHDEQRPPGTLGVHDLTLRLEEALEILRAIRSGEVDAVAVKHGEAEQIYTLKSPQQLLADKVFAHSSDGILIADRNNRIISVNPAFTRISGYGLEEVIGRNPGMLSSARHDREFYRRMWQQLRATGEWSGEIWDRRKSGEIYPSWLTINAVYDERSGEIAHYVAIFTDMSERLRFEERIRFLAYHDALTRLPNRFAVSAQLPQLIAVARREQQTLAVLFLDLDRFKTINDSLGHHVGDELLVQVGERLREAVRATDIVARIGGDEFLVLLPDAGPPAAVSAVAGKLIKSFEPPVRVGDHQLYSGCSMGIALFPEDGEDPELLLQNADTAMYHAKAQGRGHFEFFSSEMNRAANERLTTENLLRRALERHELSLHFQPQVSTAGARLVGFEALLRWAPADRPAVPPDQFIPIAEECGLIGALGEWALREACRELKGWLARGVPPVRLAVNLSALQLRDSELPRKVAAILETADIDPHLIEFEVTESAVMARAHEAAGVLGELRAMGTTLAVDDFGTGYSSLAYLKQLPINRLKIDRSFIADIESDANDAAISRSAIALAHSLGLAVVAEGVEGSGQLDWLIANGCDETQGFYWSPPLPGAEAAALVGRWPG